MRTIQRSLLAGSFGLTLAVVASAGTSCSDDNGGGSSSGSGNPSQPGGANGQPVIGPSGFAPRPDSVPLFPGSGISDAGDPLPDGMVCDSVPGTPEQNLKAEAKCYFDQQAQLAATLEQVLECADGKDAVHVRLTFHPWFVDNTYGVNAIGWDARAAMMPAMMAAMMGKMPKAKMGKSGHTFKDLVGSDHAEIQLKDSTGKVVLQFKLDYISEDPSRPSGYGSLGVTGGEGKMIVGDAAAVVDWSTSLDRNLNERGHASYTVDSPATDADFSPNPQAPDWDFRVVYEAWIDPAAFGSAGFGGGNIEFVHASPSKAASNTLDVEPGDCPCKDRGPDEDCGDTPPPDGGTTDPCLDNDPDTWCGDSGVPPPPPGDDETTPFCKQFPMDPTCTVD
jgi:hypothetical protein